ncbi:MAG: DUF4365 domain-containing protein [Aestuariivita sp.]|nr:DUF4365 domain-containing protein [Aestuariivita sp.]
MSKKSFLSDNLRKEYLSLSCLSAIAAQAGHIFTQNIRPDVDSVDVNIRTKYCPRIQFDIQVKSTSSPKIKEDGLHYNVKQKNYEDMIIGRMVPLYLFVFQFPSEEEKWLKCSVESLIIKKCFWWESLSKLEFIQQKSKTIIIPHSQRIGSSGLNPVIEHLRGQKL